MRLVVSSNFFRLSRRPLASSPNTILPEQATIVTPSASSVSILSVIPASQPSKLPEKPTACDHPMQVLGADCGACSEGPFFSSRYHSGMWCGFEYSRLVILPHGNRQDAKWDEAHYRHRSLGAGIERQPPPLLHCLRGQEQGSNAQTDCRHPWPRNGDNRQQESGSRNQPASPQYRPVLDQHQQGRQQQDEVVRRKHGNNDYSDGQY